MHQQRGFMLKIIGAVIPLMNFFALTGGRIGRNFHRIFQQTLGKVLNRIAFQRCRKEQGLFTPARFASNMFDILSEAHIQHTVCFVEDQRFNRAAIEVLFFYVLQQTSGRGDHNVLVFAEHFCVVHIGHAAGDGGNIQMRMFRQFAGMIGHLHRQLASWGEDQNTRRTGFLTWEIEQVLQRWQQIRRRFTGACRRRTEYITAIERRRNGGSLNGGRASETFILEGFQQAFVEFKFGKSRYSHVLPLCGALIIDVTAAIFICLYGYRFSGIVLTRCYRRFSCKVLFSCHSLHPCFVVMDLLLNSFLLLTIAVR